MGNTSVAAVVISYSPSRELLRNIEILSRQVAHVVVVDNTPRSSAAGVVNQLEGLPGCTVLRNGKNLGIAAALNIGIRHAIAQGYSWLLTMDQDSTVSEGYLEAMLSAHAEAEKYLRVGLVCPRYIDSRLNTEIPKLRAGNGEISGCMTSGSMIEASTFEALGPFEEPLFIDYVDYEYCQRMRFLGLKIVECPQAVLVHSLGRSTMHHILGRDLPATNHSARRRYYINRNRLVLIRRYFRKDRDWAMQELKALVLDSIMVMLVEDHKFPKAGSMLRALYDGMLNRLGQRVPL